MENNEWEIVEIPQISTNWPKHKYWPFHNCDLGYKDQIGWPFERTFSKLSSYGYFYPKSEKEERICILCYNPVPKEILFQVCLLNNITYHG